MLIQIEVKDKCGLYVRWYHNGWHYWMFSVKYELSEVNERKGIRGEFYSAIDRREYPTKIETKEYITVGDQSIPAKDYFGVKGIFQSEKVEAYMDGWKEIKIPRGTFSTRGNKTMGFDVSFTAEL